jgi:uncharacterized protein YrrD
MIRFSELLGHDAVELGTAITVGKVTGIVLERDRIVSLLATFPRLGCMALMAMSSPSIRSSPSVRRSQSTR